MSSKVFSDGFFMLNVRVRVFVTVPEPVEQGNGLSASFCLRPCVRLRVFQ